MVIRATALLMMIGLKLGEKMGTSRFLLGAAKSAEIAKAL
jgi:hypothetical protein